MPLDARVKRFLDLLAASQPRSALQTTVAQRRAGLAALLELGGPAPAIGAIEQCRVSGGAGTIGARVYTPLDCADGPLAGLVYFHGGGHVAGTIDTHDSIARALANGGAVRVVSVDYRLAPEYPFPAAVDDALAAVTHVSSCAADFGIDRTRLGVCGDSAGGTLAATTCLSLSSAASPVLALQVLLCPILDYGRTAPSWREFGSGYLIDDATLEHDLLCYLPDGVDAADPRISPLRVERLCGLPRTLIHTAEFDPLRDDGKEYFERLSRAGCDVSYTCHAGMIHLFYGLGSVIPAAHAALAQIGAQIRDAFRGGATGI